MDKIIIPRIQAMGCHGVNPAERIVKQPFSVDITMYLDLSAAEKSDDLADTVSYADIYTQVARAVSEESFALVEALAGHIAALILADMRVARVRVRVEKSQARQGNYVFPAAVELEREQPEDGHEGA